MYPEISLAVARKKRDEAREKLAAGIDPNEAKREVKRTAGIAAASSFEAVARELFDNQRAGWSETYAEKVIHSLEIDAYPKIGSRPIASIEAPDMLEIIRAIEARGVRETAKRLLQRSRAVFQYAIMTGRCPIRRHRCGNDLKKGAGSTAHGQGEAWGDSAAHARYRGLPRRTRYSACARIDGPLLRPDEGNDLRTMV